MPLRIFSLQKMNQTNKDLPPFRVSILYYFAMRDHFFPILILGCSWGQKITAITPSIYFRNDESNLGFLSVLVDLASGTQI